MSTFLDSSEKLILCKKYHNGSRFVRNCQDGSEAAVLDSPQGSKSTGIQFQYGSGCFKNMDLMMPKSSIMDVGCSGVTDIKPTELNPERRKLTNYLHVMKFYFQSFGELIQQLIIESKSDNLPDPALFLQQLGKCEETLTKAVHDAAKAASYLKTDNNKKKR